MWWDTEQPHHLVDILLPYIENILLFMDVWPLFDGHNLNTIPQFGGAMVLGAFLLAELMKSALNSALG